MTNDSFYWTVYDRLIKAGFDHDYASRMAANDARTMNALQAKLNKRNGR